jgi:hypothetical protein
MTVPPTALRSSQALRRMIFRMSKDPQAIRDFARTLLRSPASFPTISPDRQRHCQMARATSKGRGVIPVEGTSAPWHYTTFPEALDHWQSLAAGGVALIAALVAIFGAEFFARGKERREIEALRASFGRDPLYIDLLIKTREILMTLKEAFGKGQQPQRDFRDLMWTGDFLRVTSDVGRLSVSFLGPNLKLTHAISRLARRGLRNCLTKQNWLSP